jgi:Fe-S oxidoreductase
MLRNGNHAQINRELRKLHLRWWHAPRTHLEKILTAAGVPQQVIDQVPDVVETCRECRACTKPGPSPTPVVDLIVKQNEQVEADILFYKQYQIWHMLDRSDRWHTGQ